MTQPRATAALVFVAGITSFLAVCVVAAMWLP